MEKGSKHLITTADERTWKSDRPVLFLGEWCQLYDRRALWMSMNGEVAVPFTPEPDKKSNDIEYLHALTDQLLIELGAALNALHRTTHSSRYWNILLGHWLRRYVNVCYNRYFTLDQTLRKYKITSTTILCSEDFSLATPDSSSFVQACDNDRWNNMFYARVLEHMGIKAFNLTVVLIEKEEIDKQQIVNKVPHRFNFRTLVKTFIKKVTAWFLKNNDALIISTYMPKWQEIKLNLALWQSPQFWKTPPLINASADLKLRKKFALSSNTDVGFEQFVRDLLPDTMPICYLEGYLQLTQQAESLNWPANPKFIFTSNSFDADEIFKAWTGIKTEQGVPYFTAQHGNNYGTLNGIQNWPEQVSVDRFFTWGWTNGNSKNIPAFVLKTNNVQLKSNPKGGLLLLGVCVEPMCTMFDDYHEHGIYQKQQFLFVEALPQKIQKSLTVRLHDRWVKTRWSDEKRWSDHKLSLQMDLGFEPVKKAIGKNRLVVHAYDSTGILEGLTSNIPTMCFWNGGLDHLLPVAKPYYELLRDVGILLDSPESAAHDVAKHWDDIDGWWGSEKVQRARVMFCEQYARVEKQPAKALSRMLRTVAGSHDNQAANSEFKQ
ncbi:LIC12162 family protein [Oceanospirillaceae bacterium]|nr:LIC12162 family protein [Oceanospirillaceae bacterium]